VIAFLVRHGDAEPTGPGGEDASRALTGRGFAQAEALARFLPTACARIDRVLTSPLRRARETADPIAREVGLTPVEATFLAPGAGPEETVGAVAALGVETAVLVGHAPDLGLAITWIVSGDGRTETPLGKGGVACVEFDRPDRQPAGVLRWLLPADLVMRLARRGGWNPERPGGA
jgi:phosphohistidine phosphatase SixA